MKTISFLLIKSVLFAWLQFRLEFREKVID